MVLLGNDIRKVACIIIETDGEHAHLSDDRHLQWPKSRVDRIEAVRNAGIVGLGGAVFPTADKLAACTPCETLIINGAECEPYISCDDMLMREHATGIIDGAQLLREALQATECIIAVEDDKPEALAAIRDAVQAADDSRLRVAEVLTVYPAGGELQLIELLTGREIPADNYPADCGILTQNTGTAYAVHRLARQQEPLLSRIVTITGGAVAEPCNVEALLGTPVRDLIELCGGYLEIPARLIAGGSMMGIALPSDEFPVTQATNCLLVAAPGELREDRTEWPCIRCGACATACPVHLLPQELHRAAEHNDFATLETLALRDCMECGCCDAVCPSHIMLTEQFRTARRALQEHDKRSLFSAASAKRHQLREQRRQEELDDARSRQNALRQQVSGNAEDRHKAIEDAIKRVRDRKGTSAVDATDASADPDPASDTRSTRDSPGQGRP